ncbi:SA1002 family membrane protein [Limosilactobacillus reuteri]
MIHLILLIAVLVGIMLSNFLGWFQHHYHYHMTSLTIMEYYIQWSLIYTTIYQVIFNDLSKSSKYMLKIVAESRIINPDYIIMALFPALISTWIAIVIYKVQQKQI